MKTTQISNEELRQAVLVRLNAINKVSTVHNLMLQVTKDLGIKPETLARRELSMWDDRCREAIRATAFSNGFRLVSKGIPIR